MKFIWTASTAALMATPAAAAAPAAAATTVAEPKSLNETRTGWQCRRVMAHSVREAAHLFAHRDHLCEFYMRSVCH